jgi:hypothetical protein
MTDDRDTSAPAVSEDKAASVPQLSPDDEPSTEEPDGKEGKDKSLADKVEATIRGFLEFVFSYSKTFLYACSLRKIATYDSRRYTEGKKLVRPLTFLCCSYLPCAVILELSGSSFWEVLLSPEAAVQRLATRLQEISPAKLLLTSIPVLVSVYLGASLLARLLTRQQEQRDDYRYGMCYAFGLQFAGTALLLFFVLIGHSRISEQLAPPAVIDVLLWPILGGRLFFVLAFAIAAYPLVASVFIARRVSRRNRAARLALALGGSLLIMAAAYWLGAFPARFKDVTQPEPRPTAEIFQQQLSTEAADPRKCVVQVLIHNATSKAVIIQKVGGIRVTARLNDSGPTFPRNAFSANITAPESPEPIIVIRPGSAAWVSGNISPDYRDWQLLKQSQQPSNSLYIRVSVVTDGGATIDSGWQQVSLSGKFPDGL